MKKTEEKRLEYEMRQVDAWQEEGCWVWNESWHVANMSVPANVKNLEKALLYRMRKTGIVSRHGRTKLVDVDGSLYELQDKKTDEPLLAFIPINH